MRTHTYTHTTAGTMPREQQAGAQEDDAGTCAPPPLHTRTPRHTDTHTHTG